METYYGGEGRECIMAALLARYPHAAMAHEKPLLETAVQGVSSRAQLFWRRAVVQDARARIGLPREEGGELRNESSLSRLSEGAVVARAQRPAPRFKCTALSEGARTRLGVQGVSLWLGDTDGQQAEMQPRRAPIPVMRHARIAAFEKRILASEENMARLTRVRLISESQKAEVCLEECAASPFATNHLAPQGRTDEMLMLADSRARRRGPVLAQLLGASMRSACARVAAIPHLADAKQALEAALADPLRLGMMSDVACCRDVLAYTVPIFFEEQCLYALHVMQAMADAARLSDACSANALHGRRLAEIDRFAIDFASLARGDGASAQPDTHNALSVAQGMFLAQCPQEAQRALAEKAIDAACALIGGHEGALLPSFYSYHNARHGPYVMDVARELSAIERPSATADERIAAYSPVLAAVRFASSFATGAPCALAAQEEELLNRAALPPQYDLVWNADTQERSLMLQLCVSAPRGCRGASVSWDLHTAPAGGRYTLTTKHLVTAPSSDILRGAGCETDAAGAGYLEDVLLRMPASAEDALRLRGGQNTLTGSAEVNFCDEEGRLIFSHRASIFARLRMSA